ncbi:type II toxin-antitoxin system VapC family toxin [Jiella marina]|uniref:type II toxin-antitoxin system VapC family toxin n=1 Tax=Jiella sp. LLJ827 TaxID=2917712 RepID=UPI002100C52F|nr:type II toxin-antitoxin system VapC family toxin [Jiella sp. LLJ827]
MIAVDTSALIAILQDEPSAAECLNVLKMAESVCISAGTVAESLIIADRRAMGNAMRRLIFESGFEVVVVTAARSQLIAEAYDRFGKGIHPAGLNLGDCFAYALANERNCPLLFIGNDFARTDIEPAIGHPLA